MFQTRYNRVKTPPEENSGEVLVETAGYISAKQQIESLMNAGLRLSRARQELYDFPDGIVDENLTVTTRVANYDMADAFQESLSVEDRLKASQDAQDAHVQALKVEEAKRILAEAEASQEPEKASSDAPE